MFPLSLIAEFGLGTLITRDVARNPDSGPAYLRATSVIRLWLGGALTVLLWMGAPLFSSDPAVVSGLRISAPLIIILPFFGAFTALFRARQSMWPIPWLNLGMLVAQVALTFLVLFNGGDVIAALMVNTVTSAGQLAAAWVIWRWKFADVAEANGLSAPTRMLPLLRRAWPFAVAALLAALQTRASTILLERLTDTAQVGYFAAATRFVEAGRMIPNAFFGALFPLLAALAVQPQELSRTFTRAMWGLAAFGIALAVCFSLFASTIISLTFGPDFQPTIPVLQIAMWSLLPSLLRGGRTLYWYAQGQEGYVNVVTGLALLAQIGLCLWWIPQYGAFGAAWASVAAETVALALLWRPIRFSTIRQWLYAQCPAR